MQIQDKSYQDQETKDRKLVEESQGYITESYNYAKKKFAERKTYNDLYYVNTEEYRKLKRDESAKFLSSKYHGFAEQKICLYAQGLTGTDIQPFFTYSALDNYYVEGTAKALTKLAYIDLQKDNYYDTNYKTCQHAVVDGLGIERPYWNYKEMPHYQEPIEQIEIDEYGNSKVVMVDPEPIFIPYKDHVGVVSVAPNDLWVDPKAKNEDQLRYLVERNIWTFSYLKQLEKAGLVFNIDSLKDTKYPVRNDMNALINSLAHERKDYESHYTSALSDSPADKEDPLIEVLVIWKKGFYYMIANERILICRRKSLPWLKSKPFPHTFYSNHPNNYRFDGFSDFFFTEPTIREGNKLANMFIDGVHKHMNPTNFINGLLPAADIELIKSGAPNVTVQSIGTANIQQFRPDMPSNSVYGLMGDIVNSAKEDMAVTDSSGHGGGSEIRTIGQTQIAAQFGQVRPAVKLQMLANRKREVGLCILDLYRHFLTEDKIIQAGGRNSEELMLIKSELDLQYNLDMNITPAADAVRSYELEAMRGMFSDFTQIPGFNMRNAAVQMANKAGIWKNGSDLFEDDPNAVVTKEEKEAGSVQRKGNPAFAGGQNPQSPDAGGGMAQEAQQQVTPTQAGSPVPTPA